MTHRHCVYDRILAIAVAFAMAYAPVFTAHASADQSLALVKTVIEKARSKEQILGVLSNAGVSIESMKIIGEDLDKRLPSPIKKSRVVLQGEDVLLDGKPSGIKVLSFSPLKVKAHGHIWTYKRIKTADENYVELLSLMEKKRAKLSLWSLLVPEAKAIPFANSAMSGGINYGVMGLLAGGLVGLAVGFPVMLGGFLAGGAGAIFGFMKGRQNEKAIAKATGQIR